MTDRPVNDETPSSRFGPAYAALAAQLRAERERQGLSQRELGRRIGEYSTNLCNWEKGRNVPGIAAASKWAAGLGLKLALIPTEDKRGRYLDNEGIGAGAEGNQLITWGGDIDQIVARSPHGSNRVFLVLGMLGLDPYRSEETCPQVRITLTEFHARQLAACINHVLEGGIEAVAEQRDAR